VNMGRESSPIDPRSRTRILAGGCLTAIGAGVFAVFFFDLLTAPRDPMALLTPPASPVSPAATIARAIGTVLPPTPQLYLTDNFAARNNWPRVVGDAPYGYMENGYLIAPPGEPQFTSVLLNNFSDKLSRDLSVQAEANPLPGSSGVSYGILFWHDSSPDGQERFLYFGVGSDGTYTLRASVPISMTTQTPPSSRWVDLVPMTPSTSVKRGSEPNRMRVDVHPHRILAFVNGVLVLDRDNSDVDAFRQRDDFDGRVGLLAFPLDKPRAQVIFTEFELYADVSK
jgi:hypothetical protein